MRLCGLMLRVGAGLVLMAMLRAMAGAMVRGGRVLYSRKECALFWFVDLPRARAAARAAGRRAAAAAAAAMMAAREGVGVRLPAFRAEADWATVVRVEVARGTVVAVGTVVRVEAMEAAEASLAAVEAATAVEAAEVAQKAQVAAARAAAARAAARAASRGASGGASMAAAMAAMEAKPGRLAALTPRQR